MNWFHRQVCRSGRWRRRVIARRGRTNSYQLTSDGLKAAILYLGGLSHIIRPIASNLDANPQLSERLATRIAPLIAEDCRPAA
jgi:hypothetical protein